tara:strand:- start:1099 stop:1905 length:807 start_codon:yes stop_codon:yes gene_type:complete
MSTFLLIDGSYYIFYRFHALLSWWKHAKPDIQLDENPFKNEEFKSRFIKVFISKKDEIIKKLKIEKALLIVALDCPRQDIWRNSLYCDYKKGRANNKNVGDAFKLVFEENLFEKMGANMVLKHPKLEADDCVAITIKNIRRLSPDKKIYIITSDMDYLQIANENTIPINLQFKPLQESKQSFKDNEKDLFCKIIMGDKSDNIPSVFKKCGIKTAEKYYNNKSLFENKLEETEEAKKIYDLNKKLIDFNEIPIKYIKEVNSGEYTTIYN